MDNVLLFSATTTEAGIFAVKYLRQARVPITNIPGPEVTHLLLDIPSFRTDNLLRNGTNPEEILRRLPQGIRIIGGNLNTPVLMGYHTNDLLTDERYLAKNASITADCAVKISTPLLKVTFEDTYALVIGWGRIGKCLSRMLQKIGCQVTVAARNPADRAMLQALGYEAMDIATLQDLSRYHLIYNTVPEQILTQGAAPQWGSGIKIDLASRQGLVGSDVIWARGLPGIHAPDSSGKLIANTVLQYL